MVGQELRDSFDFMVEAANLSKEDREAALFLVVKFYSYAFGDDVVDKILFICDDSNNPNGQEYIRVDFSTRDYNYYTILESMTDGLFYVVF